MVSITERGLDVLRKEPKKIDNNLLKQFQEFLEFQNVKKDDSDGLGPIDNSQTEKQTPEETVLKEFGKDGI
jgi:restriction system protein